ARGWDYLNRLRGMIESADAGDRIRLIEECQDVKQFYQIADICCCCSWEESHPRVVLEAMAFGKPLVATRVGGIPEQVVHEQSALLIPPGDSAALGEAIQRLLEEPRFAQELGVNARQRFEDEFTSDVMISKYLSLVREIITNDKVSTRETSAARVNHPPAIHETRN
ncbi:MAG: glycosyltransferase family 4 protein, partial [Planctomycetota bacterium]|nr:glycosyltransferase family 4 protein [Planctomycetota bacterium]